MDTKAMIDVLWQHVQQQLDLERRTHGATVQQCHEVTDGLAAKLIDKPTGDVTGTPTTEPLATHAFRPVSG
jgi:hypothetical protein